MFDAAVSSEHSLLSHSKNNVDEGYGITCTVLPVKSDSDVMFCLQSTRDLESIDYVCINPIRRLGLIHK